MKAMKYVTERERKLPVYATCDVLVAGGGVAGVSAALAAARQGANVMLIEANCALGGLGTLGLITVYEPLCDGYGNQVIFGIAEELLRLSIQHGYESRYPDAWLDGEDIEKRKKQRFSVQYNAQFFALDMERLLIANGVTILYRTKVYNTLVKDGRITEVLIDNKAGRSAIRANAFVDATGDADLCHFSGEATELFLKNRMVAWYYYAYNGGYKYYPQGPQGDEKRYNGLDDETEMILKNHNLIYTNVLKKKAEDPSVMPVTIPTIPEVRMTRRLSGVCEPNLEQAEKGFADAIGRMGDWHQPKGVYQIPYSSLYGRNIQNLVTAGRCISQKDDMWDLCRVIPVCSLTGEAAGAAAARVAATNKSFRDVPVSEIRKIIGYRD